MPLWGTTTADESKPKYLTAEEQASTYATASGWVFKRPDGTEELLVAIGGLAAALGAADVSDIFFANTAASYTQGNANAFVTVSFNESVVVTGAPTIVVTGSGTAASTTATYATGSGSSKLQFKFTVPAEAQTLSLAAQSIVLAGGTIKDSSNTNATLTIAAGDIRGVRAKAGANASVVVA
jgi:hypothetical protein